MHGKISIIIPVYNVEKYVYQCLESIMNQTYENWEAIVVDDGSLDNSGSICDAFSKKDLRFHIIHQKNGGIAAARNSGLNYATGKYITFLDSDDFIVPDLFQKALGVLTRTNADLVQWDVNFHHDPEYSMIKNGNKIESEYTEIITDTEGALSHYVDTRGVGDDPRYNNLWNDCRCVWTKLCKREVFEGISFPNNRQYEDDYICHRLFGNANVIALINSRMTNYRYRSNSAIRTMNAKGKLDKLDCEYDRLCYIQEKGFESLLPHAAHNYFISLLNCYTDNSKRKDKKVMKSLLERCRNDYRSYKYNLNKSDKFVVELFCKVPNLLIILYVVYRKTKV